MQISTNTGKLNQRITIQYRQHSLTDGIGYQKNGWTDLHTCWAAVNTASGSESWQSGERVQESTVNFKIRACKRLKDLNTTEYRIIFGGRYYDIIAIDDMLFAGSLLNIRAAEKKPLYFTDGIAALYRVQNTAQPGDMPQESLILLHTAQFNYEKLANRENYTAMQRYAEREQVVRISLHLDISVHDAAVISGLQYSIRAVEHDKQTLPPSTLLTLQRLEADYDITGIQRSAALSTR